MARLGGRCRGRAKWEKARQTDRSHSRFLDILDFQASDLVTRKIVGIVAEREIPREGADEKSQMMSLVLF